MNTPRLSPDTRYWATSDTHFGHRYVAVEKRGFRSRADHDAELIDAWNDVVGPDDVVIHLGDVTFRNVTDTVAIFSQLKGHLKIVPGNHDASRVLRRIIDTKLSKNKSQSEILPRLYEVKYDSAYLSFCHYPLAAWNQSDSTTKLSINLHGHLHGSSDHHHAAPYLGPGFRYDVGVDTVPGFAPVMLDSYVERSRP